MSKIKLPLRRYNLVLLFVSLFLSAFANEEYFIGSYPASEIEQRIESLSEHLDFRLTSDVRKYLTQFIEGYRPGSEKLIGRSLYYFPLIEQKISEKELPEEIKYLAMVESSLDPQARSRVGAVGLWQFMRPTAKMYGLHMDNTIDERRNPEKSTEAALNYLADLYKRFGDWTLALAAYNCGPGNVNKAMRKSGRSDYWGIRNYLPKETRMYVPKFIAISYMMTYYMDHELVPEFPEQLFTETRKAIVYDAVSFHKVSELTGMSLDEIKWYNPEYISNYIPSSDEGNILELPNESLLTYLDNEEVNFTLIEDPFMDLHKETFVASMKLEKREDIEIVTIGTLDGPLAILEHKRELEPIALNMEWVPEQKANNNLSKRSYIFPRRREKAPEVPEQRKIIYHKETMSFRLD